MLEIFLVSGRGVGVCLLTTFVRLAIRYFICTMFYNYTLKGRAKSQNYRSFTFITYLLLWDVLLLSTGLTGLVKRENSLVSTLGKKGNFLPATAC